MVPTSFASQEAQLHILAGTRALGFWFEKFSIQADAENSP